ncbi:MAG: hypothetical protein IKO40_06295, partial [Kiritimatiellae bacterium]|nr:hypothetical protein [Kiritimatiellia bacterium]
DTLVARLVAVSRQIGKAASRHRKNCMAHTEAQRGMARWNTGGLTRDELCSHRDTEAQRGMARWNTGS